MLPLTVKRRWWHRSIQKLAATSFGLWLLPKTLHRIDSFLFKLTKNSLSLTALLAGLPVILLTTTGAKSGQVRQNPLTAIADGPKLILIASYFGSLRHPSWYYNLAANPTAQVSFRHQAATYHARQAIGSERDRYWQMAKDLYAGFSLYERTAGERKIPIMVLEPITPPPNEDLPLTA